MRALPLVVLLLALLTPGCIQMLSDELEEAREEFPDPSAADGDNGTAPPPATPSPTPGTPAPATPSPTPPSPATPSVPSPATPTPTATPTPPPPATPTPTPTPPSPPTTPATPPSPTPPPPAAWPREGSHVRYHATVERVASDGSYRQEERAEAAWTYRDGDWTGTCTVEVRERVAGRGEETTTRTRTFTASDPPHWPIFNTRSPPAPGGAVTTWLLDGCDIEHLDDAVYQGTDTEAGAATHVAAYPEARDEDFRTEWSRASGLVVTWDWIRWGATTTHVRGGLVATDAPP